MMWKWLDKWYWRYLFAPPYYHDSRWPLVDLAMSVWCRYRVHPAGIVYFNPEGLEPDYHCRNCGDELN